MMVLSVENLEEILRKGIEENIDILNACTSEVINDKYDKWQKVNDLYYSLEGIDNPIVRAMLALRAIGFAYEANDTMERMLVQKCVSVAEKKKIHGARAHTIEKRESILATIASVTEESLNDIINKNFIDEGSVVFNKLEYLKEFKKLAESSISIKDVKFDSGGAGPDEEARRKQDIITIMEQYKRLEQSNG